MGVDLAGGALSHEVTAAIFYDEGEESALRGGGALGEIGKLFDISQAMGAAILTNGTLGTLGLFGGADERAEFHQGLI